MHEYIYIYAIASAYRRILSDKGCTRVYCSTLQVSLVSLIRIKIMTAQICNANMETFWPLLKWPDFADMQDKEQVVIILPLVGFADFGLNLPLDMEEVMAMAILEKSSQGLSGNVQHLVLPPLRFVTAPTKESVFGMSADDVYESIREIALSIKNSGFRKLVLYNSSPLNEDLADAAGRDLRIDLGMQMFIINLAGLGLDLLSGRSTTRVDCLLLASYILNRVPGNLVERSDSITNFNTQSKAVNEEESNPELSPEEAEARGKGILNNSADKLSSLIKEVSERKPLANDGVIPDKKGSEK